MKVGPQVQRGVQFVCRLVRAKRCLRINRQAKFYRRGIESVDGYIQVDRYRRFGIKRALHSDQLLHYLPRLGCIGVAQCDERNCLAAQIHVTQPLGLST